ncbi:MAG: hypothetical protein H0V88_00205 [Pyrinomonadaceae bacterium]|nr:hypothetical protein [Pyrinomonadaceae bacterium]
MQKYIAKLFVVVTTLGVLLSAVATPAEAQYRRGNRNRAYSKAEVERVIRRVEESSDRFVGLFDRSLDRSRLNNSEREDRLNERAKDLEGAIDALRSDFDRTDRYRDTQAQVSRVLSVAQGINNVMRRRRFEANTERQWSLVRTDLNTLANYYNLRPLR